jgi:hypothetical protein
MLRRSHPPPSGAGRQWEQRCWEKELCDAVTVAWLSFITEFLFHNFHLYVTLGTPPCSRYRGILFATPWASVYRQQTCVMDDRLLVYTCHCWNEAWEEWIF